MVNKIRFFVPSPKTDKTGRPIAMDGMNDMIARERGSLYAAAQAKKSMTAYVARVAAYAAYDMHWHTPEERCLVTLVFVEANHRRDPDNIVGGAKYVLDGLTLRSDLGAGLIIDDSQQHIDLVCKLSPHIDRDRPGVWVIIEKEDS